MCGSLLTENDFYREDMQGLFINHSASLLSESRFINVFSQCAKSLSHTCDKKM